MGKLKPVDKLQEGEIITSIEFGDDDSKKMFYNALNGQAMPISENIGKEIELTDYLVEVVKLVRNGEDVTAPRVVLVGKDKGLYSCISGGIYRDLMRLETIFDDAPWDGLKVKFDQRKTKSGKMYGLSLV